MDDVYDDWELFMGDIVTIKFDGLKNDTKYYGEVVAQFELYNEDESFISPIRRN